MRRVLLIDQQDQHASQLKAALRRCGFDVSIENQHWRAIQKLRQRVPECEFVVVVTTSALGDEVSLLRDLIEASQQLQQSGLPKFLLASCVRCTPSHRIQIAKMGARYVRI
jgi:ActR/RegA family two-component response regulator